MVAIAHLSMAPIPLNDIPANLRRHVDPKAPLPLRDMGAKGLAPGLSPADLAIILYQLQFDPEASLAQTAAATFSELPPALVGPITTADLPVAVLDFCARRWLGQRDDLIEALIRNRAIDDQTVAMIASRCSDRLAEIVAENQIRLARTPLIIEQLYQNPKAHQSVIDRVVEFAQRQNLDTSGLPGLEQALTVVGSEREDTPVAAKAAPNDNIFSAILQSSLEQAHDEDARGITTEHIQEKFSAFAELLEGALQQSTDIDFGNLDGDDPHKAAQMADTDEERIVNKQVLIGKMRIAQKVRLACIGSREDRALLVRDPNRLVHMAAIRSPKIQPADIKDFAGNKDLPSNVINHIASKKDSTRDYTMLLKLVNNPKLTLATGLRMLNFMRVNDLKALSSSRNVNPQLSKQAKLLMNKRNSNK